MQIPTISRRKVLQFMGTSAGAALTFKSEDVTAKEKKHNKPKFVYCLNMATIRGHKLGFVKEIQTAAAAGFGSVEIWMDSLQDYLNKGGTVHDAKKRLDDLGLKIEDSISFNEWIVDDEKTRAAGIENMKKEMGMLAELGCKRIAATGMGSPNMTAPNLDAIAERYSVILKMGETTGVIPQLEMWGFMKNLSNVSEVLYSAMQSGLPSARMLLDIFHLYKGQTKLDTLLLMDPSAVEILHMNDYPSTLSYEVITDADRIYPGDGVAPLSFILQTLSRNNHPLVLSTELFNKNYYAQNALTVAKTSLSKMKLVTEAL
jgi:2-keto-myo-inositol isomerase